MTGHDAGGRGAGQEGGLENSKHMSVYADMKPWTSI